MKTFWQAKAWFGPVRQGWAGHGPAGRGMVRSGTARHGKAGPGMAGRGMVWVMALRKERHHSFYEI
jgi:hypothetical protein